jgi:hypothetical protein
VTDQPQSRTNQYRILRIIALFCACMVVFASTLVASHSCTTAEQASGHCEICIAIHTVAPTASAPAQIILHAAPESLETPTLVSPEKVRVTTLSDRAPPALA